MKKVGARIREIRKGKGLTLRAAAQRAEVAVSTLSNIESGRHAISLANLRKIAAALDVPAASLLPDEAENTQYYVPPARRLRFHYEGIEAQLLTHPGDPMGLNIFLLEFARGVETPPAAPHRGWEYVYVIEGELEGMLGEDRLERLKAGDFVCFRADRPHRVRALGPARILMVAFATGWLPGRP